MNLPIVYEDEDFLVLNKPFGLAVHKSNPDDPQETVADIIKQQRPATAVVGEDPLRPGIVHRLDKETSGLLIVAKNNESFFYFKRLFQEHAIKKSYLALVYGHLRQNQGTIRAPLGKLGARQTTRTRGKHQLKEREAATSYRTLRNFKDYTLLEITPLTGRTHQIRVHLKSIGVPVVGDKLYAPAKTLPLGLERLFLHALRLEFTAPRGKRLVLEADLPEDLQKVLSELQ